MSYVVTQGSLNKDSVTYISHGLVRGKSLRQALSWVLFIPIGLSLKKLTDFFFLKQLSIYRKVEQKEQSSRIPAP